MYDVVIRYEDGSRAKVEDHIGDLGDACAFVLKLADQLGGTPTGDDPLPKWVEIYKADKLEISVSVVTGGLATRRAERGSLPT